MLKRLQILFVFLLLPFVSMAQVTVTGQITSDTYWTADTEYILDGIVYVTNGASLYIEAGTVIKAEDGQDVDATALVITRGSKIFAEGTATDPIIFTSINDDGSLTKDDTGEWGGVIILGKSITNNDTEKLVEGLNQIETDPALAGYGGTDPMDNSGVMRYVSIRYSGVNVGQDSGNEIQGLTLGAVGAGTTLEYIESFASKDDGYEFFGGTVNTKYMISAFVEDDGFDWDQGFSGKGQFWFVIQDTDETGRAAEMDGAGGDETGRPYAFPVISNATYIGPGSTEVPGGDGSGELLMFRDNTGGEYHNSIFASHSGDAVHVEDKNAGGIGSRARLEADSLNIMNSIFFDFGGETNFANIFNDTFAADHFTATSTGNMMTDPGFGGMSLSAAGLDPKAVNAQTGAVIPDDPFFSQVGFKGAFGGKNWMKGWTALDEMGYLVDDPTPGTITVTGQITTDTYWTADNEYVLDGVVYVTDGASLYIEAGTVIKAEDGQDVDATALVITRGSKIFAEGTATDPIIFTSINDDGSLTKDDTGEWGGVIILGKSITNNDTEKLVEGLNQIETDPALAGYGGTDPMDNSGVMRYVSIRYSGVNVGQDSGNEIQGLTLGAVGAGTTLEYIESFASKDDGYEFFGGTVNTKYMISAFVEDDGFDWDQGFSGKGQFWFVIQDTDETGRAAEMDGAGGDETGRPYAFPVISNATYIGPGSTEVPGGDGSGELLMFRDNTGGEYHNSIFASHSGDAVHVEDKNAGGIGSRARLEADSLNIMNSIFFDFGGETNFANIFNDTFAADHFTATSTGNVMADPGFALTNAAIGGLDYRLALNSSAWTGAVIPDDDFFTEVSFKGAFGQSNWLAGWTALTAYGHITGSTITEIETIAEDVPTSIELKQNYPNPFNPSTKITFALPSTQKVSLKVYDMLGREVATLVNNQTISAGSTTVNFDASSLSSGVYIYRLVGGNTVVTRKMTLIK